MRGLLGVVVVVTCLVQGAAADLRIGTLTVPQEPLWPLEPGQFVVPILIDCQFALNTGDPADQTIAVRTQIWANYTALQASPPMTARIDKSPCTADPQGVLQWNQTMELTDMGRTPGAVPIRVTFEAEVTEVGEFSFGGHAFANTTVQAAWRPDIGVSASSNWGPVGGRGSVTLRFGNQGNAASLVDVRLENREELAKAGFVVHLPARDVITYSPHTTGYRILSFHVDLPDHAAVADLKLRLEYTAPADPTQRLPPEDIVVRMQTERQDFPVDGWAAAPVLAALAILAGRRRSHV